MNSFQRLTGLMALGLLGLSAPAQAQAWQWANGAHTTTMAGVTANVATSATAIMPAGDVYAAYRHMTPMTLGGQTYPANMQQYNAVLAHHDAAGTPTGVLLVGTDAIIYDLETDAAGNLYAAGRFGGQLQVGLLQVTATGNSDYFVGKWDAAGVLQWLKQGTGARSGMQQVSMAVDAAGRVTIAGSYSGSISFGTQSVTTTSPLALFAGQLDAGGQVTWLKTSTNSTGQYNVAYDVAASPDGTIYLTGDDQTFTWGGTTVGGTSGMSQGYWLKLDAGGQLLALQRFQGAPAKLAAAENGASYVAVGDYNANLIWDNATFSLSPAASSGIFIVKLDGSGVPQWVQTAENVDSSYASMSQLRAVTDLATEGQTRVYMGGSYSSSLRPAPAFSCGGLSLPRPRGFANDGYALQLDGATGSPAWMIPVAATSANDQVLALSANPAGQVSIGGTFYADTAYFGSAIRVTKPGPPTLAGASAYLGKLVQAYNLTQGTVFTDVNANATQDAGEFGRGGVVVQAMPGPLYFSTESDGQYSAVADLGNFTYSVPNPPLYYNVVSAGPNTATFSSYGTVAAGRSFALQALANQQDLQVLLTPISRPRPGFTVGYRVTYRNVGTVAMPSGALTLTHDAVLTFLSTTQGGSTHTGNTLAWIYAALQPGETRQFDVLFQLPTTAVIGSTLTSSVTIDPVAGDVTPADNQETSTLTVVGSYDPNDIQVNYATLTVPQVQTATKPLDYTVRFQNVGTDTAFSVRLRDSLPADVLNLGTIQLLAASHSCTWRMGADGVLTVNFPSIRLPHRGINTVASQGFVRFRVVPLITLNAGDQIPNQADIYFDFNAPVATNTAVTTVLSPNGLPEAGAAGAELAVWPNPAHDVLNLRLPAGTTGVTLFDATGRTVRTAAAATATTLDVRGLPAGIYILRAGSAARRVVIR